MWKYHGLHAHAQIHKLKISKIDTNLYLKQMTYCIDLHKIVMEWYLQDVADVNFASLSTISQRTFIHVKYLLHDSYFLQFLTFINIYFPGEWNMLFFIRSI